MAAVQGFFVMGTRPWKASLFSGGITPQLPSKPSWPSTSAHLDFSTAIPALSHLSFATAHFLHRPLIYLHQITLFESHQELPRTHRHHALSPPNPPCYHCSTCSGCLRHTSRPKRSSSGSERSDPTHRDCHPENPSLRGR
jgi:hypothetical protein